ncbi:hypothetical protein CPB86DRAFT_781497, partial [Serendipita vermifera]
MGCWDELCLICGLCPGGGPGTLFGDLEEILSTIMEGLEHMDLELDLNGDQLREEIRKVLLLFDEKDEDDDEDDDDDEDEDDHESDDEGDNEGDNEDDHDNDDSEYTLYERAVMNGSITSASYFPLRSEEEWVRRENRPFAPAILVCES